MAGMEVLGRNANIVPIAAGQGFKMRSASTAMIVCTSTGVNTFTVNEATAFGGPYSSVAVIKNIYWATAANGTAAWQKINYNTVTNALFANGPLSAISVGAGGTAGLTTAALAVFHIFTSELSDPNSYLQIAVSGAGTGLVQVILSDLVVQRAPVNLEILGS